MALSRPAVPDGIRDQLQSPRAPISTPLRAEDHVVRLADGRRLGYSEFGARNGRPIFFFHGFGTTRVICPPDERPAVELAVRLIAVDRPGIGLSDPQPGRRLLDWPTDVAELADRIGLESFSVIGWSGGVLTRWPAAMHCPGGLRLSAWSARRRR